MASTHPNAGFAAQRWYQSDAIIALLLAVVSFLLYLRTLAPGIVDADGGEFQFAAWNFSFVHPTGYPLFLLLGGSFQHLLPVGDPAWRLNVFTALTAALAVATLYLAVGEMMRQRAAAAVAALSFALTRTFWYDAGAAEVYDLNAFFLALLLFLAFRWQTAPSLRTFNAFCLAFGLALTHHRVIILWAPAFALFFIVVAMQARLSLHGSRITSLAWRPALALLIPVLLYFYIPLRAPTSPYAVLPLAPNRGLVLYDNSFGALANYIFGTSFQRELGWDAASAARWGMLPQWSLDQFGIIGIALGLVGLGVMFARRDWARLALLVTGMFATILFASLYHIGDIVHYYIPAYLGWAVWIGVGLAELGLALRRKTNDARRMAVSSRQSALSLGLLAVVAIGLLLSQLVANLPAADRSRDTQARDQWNAILAAQIPPNAILLSNDRDEMMPLWYIQYVENWRRDLLGLFPLVTPAPEYANIVRLADSALATQRPVYLIKSMPGLEIKYRLVNSNAPLVQVVGPAVDAPPRFSSKAVLGDRVRVTGYDTAKEGQGLRVAIYWQPRDRLVYNYTTFAQLVDERGQKVAQGIDHQVGGEFYPTGMWEKDQVLRDEHIIAIPESLSAQQYRLVVGMYRQPGLEPLGEPVQIGTIDLR